MMKINDLSIIKHAESLYSFFFLEIIRFLLLYFFHDLNLYIYSARKCFSAISLMSLESDQLSSGFSNTGAPTCFSLG